MKVLNICVECGEPKENTDFLGRCGDCFEAIKKTEAKHPVKGPYIKEMGVENPVDQKGSTAHVRDIKSRRIDTKTGERFNRQAPKTYFFPKGEKS